MQYNFPISSVVSVAVFHTLQVYHSVWQEANISFSTPHLLHTEVYL